MLTTDFETNILFKLINNREFTSDSKRWYEESLNQKTYNINCNQVYLDNIPSTPPSIDTDVIQVLNNFEMTEDITVGDHKCWKIYATPGDTTSEQYTNFVRPSYGFGYLVRIYDNSGTEIPLGDKPNWFFIYDTGTLVFQQNPANYGYSLPIHITAYRFIGRTAEWLQTSLECYVDVTVDGTPSASGYSGGGTAPQYGFDKESETYWESYNIPSTSNPVYLRYTFSTTSHVKQYWIVTSSQGMPSDWEVQGYDGSSWITLDTQSGVSLAADSTTSYTLSAGMNADAIQIIITGTSDGNRARIAEFVAEGYCQSGKQNFRSLSDTPNNYIDSDHKFLYVHEGREIRYAPNFYYDYVNGRIIHNDRGSFGAAIPSTTARMILMSSSTSYEANLALVSARSGAHQHMIVECWREGTKRAAFGHLYLGSTYTGFWFNNSGVTYNVTGSEAAFILYNNIARICSLGDIQLYSSRGVVSIRRGSGNNAWLVFLSSEYKVGFMYHLTGGYGNGYFYLKAYPYRNTTMNVVDAPSTDVHDVMSVLMDGTNHVMGVAFFNKNISSMPSGCCFYVNDNHTTSQYRGVLFAPMTTTNRDSISSPAEGLMIYNRDTHQYEYYNGSSWIGM